MLTPNPMLSLGVSYTSAKTYKVSAYGFDALDLVV